MQNVAHNSEELYAIESTVVAATPSVFDTGSHEEFTKFIEEGGVPHAYIESDSTGTHVGYLALSALTESDQIEVRSIAVLPAYQHRGYGKALMAEAEVIARQIGRAKMMLVTSPENTGALRFYRSLGYVIVKTVENYYGDGTPRHILEKDL